MGRETDSVCLCVRKNERGNVILDVVLVSVCAKKCQEFAKECILVDVKECCESQRACARVKESVLVCVKGCVWVRKESKNIL